MRRPGWVLLGLLAAGGLMALLWPADPAPGVSISQRAEHAAQSAGAQLSARVIADTDLPPEGTRSLFDHLVAQNDGLPYPFEKVVDWLRDQAPADRPPVTLMIPLGRSLLKAQADFERPRVLVAADYQAPNTPANLGVTARGQLFLGFVENAREIEVISYNEAAGRYEFQLVQDYAADGQRRIVYARRAVCLACHQDGTPIFPQRPWNETNAQPEIAQRIVGSRGPHAYLGVKPQTALAAPERFDELTDVGAYTVAAQRVWIDGCAQHSTCRRLLLTLALRYADDPGRFDATSAEARALRAQQQAAWPVAGIAVPESDLRNRDPLASARGWSGVLRTLFAAGRQSDVAARTNADLDAFDRLPRLPAELDPLTPRPPKRTLTSSDIDGVYALAALFSAPDLDRLRASANQDWAALEARIDRLPDAFFAPAPFSRVAVLQALLASAGRPAPGFCCLQTAALSAPVAASVPPLALAADSPLLPFARYCFACHRGNPNAQLDFMAGDSEAQVRERIRATTKIRDALDWERYRNTDQAARLMPPADSPQHARLADDLSQHPQLLEQMRAQVPGLFDF